MKVKYLYDVLMEKGYELNTISEVSKILDFTDKVIYDVGEELFDLWIQGVIDRRSLSYYNMKVKKMFYPNYTEPVIENFWSSRGGLYSTNKESFCIKCRGMVIKSEYFK